MARDIQKVALNANRVQCSGKLQCTCNIVSCSVRPCPPMAQGKLLHCGRNCMLQGGRQALCRKTLMR